MTPDDQRKLCEETQELLNANIPPEFGSATFIYPTSLEGTLVFKYSGYKEPFFKNLQRLIDYHDPSERMRIEHIVRQLLHTAEELIKTAHLSAQEFGEHKANIIAAAKFLDEKIEVPKWSKDQVGRGTHCEVSGAKLEDHTNG